MVIDNRQTPVIAHRPPIHFDNPIVGTISPYPTVVMVTTAHQNESGILGNAVSPEKKANAPNINMATTRNIDISKTSKPLARTAYISTRNPVKFLTNRNSLNIRTICRQ